VTRFRGRLPSTFRLALLVALLAALLPAAPARAGGAASAPASTALRVAFATDPSPAFRAIVDRLVPALDQLQVPGAALGVSIDGRDEVATFGVADLSTDTPVTERTRFAVGSISKTFTGTAIMRLVDQGKVDLDVPVRAYVPELRLADESVARRVTVRQLMTHAGDWWGDGFVDTGTGDDAIARYVAEHLPTAPQLAPLGMVASYKNSGFVLLGRVIEEVTGEALPGGDAGAPPGAARPGQDHLQPPRRAAWGAHHRLRPGRERRRGGDAGVPAARDRSGWGHVDDDRRSAALRALPHGRRLRGRPAAHEPRDVRPDADPVERLPGRHPDRPLLAHDPAAGGA
jgi:beta-lactamase family protein